MEGSKMRRKFFIHKVHNFNRMFLVLLIIVLYASALKVVIDPNEVTSSAFHSHAGAFLSQLSILYPQSFKSLAFLSQHSFLCCHFGVCDEECLSNPQFYVQKSNTFHHLVKGISQNEYNFDLEKLLLLSMNKEGDIEENNHLKSFYEHVIGISKDRIDEKAFTNGLSGVFDVTKSIISSFYEFEGISSGKFQKENVEKFDQNKYNCEYLSANGVAYIPTQCRCLSDDIEKCQKCKLHVVLFGCISNNEKFEKEVLEKIGRKFENLVQIELNSYANELNLIIMYPKMKVTSDNEDGCWINIDNATFPRDIEVSEDPFNGNTLVSSVNNMINDMMNGDIKFTSKLQKGIPNDIKKNIRNKIPKFLKKNLNMEDIPSDSHSKDINVKRKYNEELEERLKRMEKSKGMTMDPKMLLRYAELQRRGVFDRFKEDKSKNEKNEKKKKDIETDEL